MPRLLITGGCSFSAMTPGTKFKNWPHWIGQYLDLADDSMIHTGRTSQGNGLISRHIIYQVQRALATLEPCDLLVGVIWSGPWRHDFFEELETCTINQYNIDVVGSGINSWRIMNHHWDDQQSSLYYKYFGSYIGSVVNSYEHILRTQWFLQQHNIPYFMGAITQETLPIYQRSHPEIGYLHSMIDFDHFLPISDGLFEWARDHSGLPFADHDPGHLTSEQNSLLTNQVIIPFLEKLGYV